MQGVGCTVCGLHTSEGGWAQRALAGRGGLRGDVDRLAARGRFRPRLARACDHPGQLTQPGNFTTNIREEIVQGYLAHKKQPPPVGRRRAIGIFLLQGSKGALFLMSEVPLYQTCEDRSTTGSECVCVRDRESACVCEDERERACVCQREGEMVCVRERRAGGGSRERLSRTILETIYVDIFSYIKPGIHYCCKTRVLSMLFLQVVLQSVQQY